MSVLYLTYIPLSTGPARSARSSRRDIREDKNEHDGSQADQDRGEKISFGGSRDTDEWKTLRQCARVVSLCRVRDAMGTGMQPMMGYLRYVRPFHLQNYTKYQPSETCPPSCRPRDRQLLSDNIACPYFTILCPFLDPHALLSRC
jgi:hypothetical protein